MVTIKRGTEFQCLTDHWGDSYTQGQLYTQAEDSRVLTLVDNNGVTSTQPNRYANEFLKTNEPAIDSRDLEIARLWRLLEIVADSDTKLKAWRAAEKRTLGGVKYNGLNLTFEGRKIE